MFKKGRASGRIRWPFLHPPFSFTIAQYHSMNRNQYYKPLRTWQKLYFGIALAGTVFLIETFLPVQIF